MHNKCETFSRAGVDASPTRVGWTLSGDQVVIPLHLRLKPTPLPTGPSVIEQEMRTVLVCRAHPATRPVVMRHYLGKRNVILVHQISRQLGSPINRTGPAVTPMLTHLDPDRVLVTRSIQVRMPSSDIGWQMLHRYILINSVVPRETPKLAALEGQRVPPGIGTPAPILRTVDGNIARTHGTLASASPRTSGEVVLVYPDLAKERERQLAWNRSGRGHSHVLVGAVGRHLDRLGSMVPRPVIILQTTYWEFPQLFTQRNRSNSLVLGLGVFWNRKREIQ